MIERSGYFNGQAAMSATSPPNYPDVLGTLTGGPRCNINVVQLALAVRPRVVRAGKPFEVVLLVQNASDVDVDLTASLRLPERDARKQKDQFVSRHPRLVVGLRPAEAGYVTLPVACAATAAVYDAYKIGIAVQVKPLAKPQRIRQPQGGGPLGTLNEAAQAEFEELRKLYFTAEKRFGPGDVLETTFGVLPGRLGRIVDTHPGWVSLWTMAEYTDEAAMFSLYAPLIAEHVLPKLRPQYTVEPLREATLTNFEQAGYALKPVEALLIAKMLARVLQLADPVDDLTDYRAGHVYNVLQTINRYNEAPDARVELPYWCAGLLRAIADNRAVLQQPVRVISRALYHDLIRDAVPLAVEIIQKDAGQDISTPAEAHTYADSIIRFLQAGDGLDFERVYVPLVLGGLSVNEQVITKDDRLDKIILELETALDERSDEQTDAAAAAFELARKLIDYHSQQFRYGV